MLKRLLREKPRVLDVLRLLGGQRKPSFRGMRMEDGGPVTAEMIMKTHGVPRERAVEIARRQTR